MSIVATYTVNCQGSLRKGCAGWAGQEDTKRDALREAKWQGFHRVRVANGSMQDFWPNCYKQYTQEEGQ